MARRQPPPPRSPSTRPPQRAAVNRPAAGSAVGAAAPCVAVPPRDAPQPGRGGGASARACARVAAGLAACGGPTGALASTGGAGLPRCARVARRGVAVRGGEPHQGQQSKGRPTRDVPAGPGRPRRPPVGRLAGACRPPAQVGGRRRSLRQRARWRPDASQPSQPRHTALPPRPRKRQPVVSDGPGETGRALMRAMRAGHRAPVPWARLRQARCHQDQAPLAHARHGPWRAAPLVA
jgi:hypothetical protein